MWVTTTMSAAPTLSALLTAEAAMLSSLAVYVRGAATLEPTLQGGRREDEEGKEERGRGGRQSARAGRGSHPSRLASSGPASGGSLASGGSSAQQ